MPMMVCVPCKALFKIEKNGIDAVEMVDGQVYKVYSSDLWQCPSCGIRVLAGFGADGFIQGYQLREEPEGNLSRYLEDSKARGNTVDFKEVQTPYEIQAKEEFFRKIKDGELK